MAEDMRKAAAAMGEKMKGRLAAALHLPITLGPE
jgi:hypothetical protein